MTEIAKTLHAFYSTFGLPAYDRYSVPDDAVLPYLTYTVPQNALFEGAIHQVQIWYPTDKGAPSNVEVNSKADEILSAIGRGVKLKTASGFLCIYPGSGAVAQNQPAQDGERCVYLNLELHNYG